MVSLNYKKYDDYHFSERIKTERDFSSGSESDQPTEAPSFKLSYAKLFDTICEQIHSDETTLLLYMLVHRNSSFKSYIMARSDIEHLASSLIMFSFHLICTVTLRESIIFNV